MEQHVWSRFVTLAGSADIPVWGFWRLSASAARHSAAEARRRPVASSEHGTGMSREPAGWKACATSQLAACRSVNRRFDNPTL